MNATWKIEADAHTAAVCHRKNGPLQVAESSDYQTARTIARALSRETSGRYTVTPPQGSLVAPESFANGTSESTRRSGLHARRAGRRSALTPRRPWIPALDAPREETMRTVPNSQPGSTAPRAYTGQDARDFARIWLADGVTVAQMRGLAASPGHIARVRAVLAACGLDGQGARRRAQMRTAAAAAHEAEGFDAAAYATELGITGGAR